jgi:hypothetical protein
VTTLGEAALLGHEGCSSLTACLNPLHPGPCKGWRGTPEEAFDRVTRKAKTGIRAYNTAKTVRGAGTSKKALLSYVNGSGPINRSLRASKGEGSNDPRIVAEIASMDRAMAASKLTHPITVQRAVSPSAFGGKDTNVDLTGVEYSDHAFGSTGTDLSLILKHFSSTSSGKQPLIADITVPAGMGAIRVPPGQWGDEKEILLDRGAHYRVVKDNGYITTPKGKFRHISLEVVPGDKGKVKQVDLGEKNQRHRDSVTAAGDGFTRPFGFTGSQGLSLLQAVCLDGEFCMQTHKPGLCKGQKRGQTEPGAQDATKQTPAQVAQTAVNGLQQAIQQAQQVAAQNATNPKMAAAARRAIAGYKKALAPHQQTLKDAARSNDQAKTAGDRDTREQDSLDEKAGRDKERLGKAAQRILDRRAEKAKLAKMSPKQRTAYHKAKSAKAAAKREVAEKAILKQAGKA